MTTRREAFSLVALLGLGAPAVAGCSSLPRILGSGSGRWASDLLERVDPAAAGASPVATFTATRPRAIAELLGLADVTGTPDATSAPARYRVIEASYPMILRGAPTGGTGSPMDGEVLFTPVHAVNVAGSVDASLALWTEAAEAFDHLEDALAGSYERDGDELRLREDHPMAEHMGQLRIILDGQDIAVTGAEDPGDVLDTGSSFAEAFTDLDELLSAVDVSDPHVLTGTHPSTEIPFGSGGGKILEWVYATAMEDEQAQTTHGAIRVDGDAAGLRDLVLEGAGETTSSTLQPTEVEVDGDLLHLVLEPPADAAQPGSDPVATFYLSLPEAMGPGVPIG
ncbi:MAG: hypothetical protein Q4G40_02610 [Brachybacterium sp.]|nr:hypothetical protein [Brachybacterium sp.]